MDETRACIICGGHNFTWTEVRTPSGTDVNSGGGGVYVRYTEDHDTGRKGPFGGPVMRRNRDLQARVCQDCGNVQLFIGDWR